jgi:hypothetical protein
VIQFVSDFRQVGGFLRVLGFPPPIKYKIDRHDIADILLKVALNTIILLKNTPTEIHRTQEKDKKNKKHNTTFVGHHYTQANTNNVNKT